MSIKLIVLSVRIYNLSSYTYTTYYKCVSLEGYLLPNHARLNRSKKKAQIFSLDNFHALTQAMPLTEISPIYL